MYDIWCRRGAAGSIGSGVRILKVAALLYLKL